MSISSPCRSDSIIQTKGSGQASVELVNKSSTSRSSTLNPEDLDVNGMGTKALREAYLRTSGSSGDGENCGTKEHFKKRQNKTSWILFSIVVIFLICNLPRLIVKVFLILVQGRNVQKHFMDCIKVDQLHAPAAILIMGRFQNNG